MSDVGCAMWDELLTRYALKRMEEDYDQNWPLEVEGELQEPFVSNVKRQK